jgi:nicotinamidase-related amidase
VIPEVDRLVAAARSTGAPVAAIELTWDLEEGERHRARAVDSLLAAAMAGRP